MEADACFDREWDNLRAAHHWAIVTLEQSSAERLVKAVHAHSQGRMRAEVGDWAQRTLEATTPGSPANADLFGRAAHWKMYAGEFPAVLTLADRGMAAARSPDDPDTTLCRAFGIVAMLATGHMERLPEAFAGARACDRRGDGPLRAGVGLGNHLPRRAGGGPATYPHRGRGVPTGRRPLRMPVQSPRGGLLPGDEEGLRRRPARLRWSPRSGRGGAPRGPSSR